MSKGSQTTTQQTSTSPPGYVANAYQQYIQQLQGINQQPYVPYTGEGVAPINAQQTTGIGGVNQYANAAQPAYAQGLGLISSAANPLSAAQIQQYYDPYNQDVIKSTTDWLNQQNAVQQQQVLGNAAAQGALGGDRVGITQAALAGQQQKAEAPIIAGLESAGYNQAVQYAMQQFQQNPMAAAYGLGNLGAGSQAAGLQGAGAQISAGTLQQQTQQAQDQYNYSQYLQAQGFPYQEAQWYASQLAGIGSLAGGTSQGTTTGPPPSLFGQLLGLGTAGAGAYGAYQSAQPKTGAAGGRIKGYQTGGSPYGVAGGYVPAANMGHGPGPPQVRAPSAPGQQGGASSMFNEAQSLASMGKAGQGVGSWLGGLGGGSAMAPATGDIVGSEVGAGIGDVATGVAGDAALALPEMAGAAGGADALAMLPLLLAQKGGRIQLPMRAGMGMPSFVRGYQEGGSPETDIGTYNDTSLPMWKRVGLSGPPSDDAAATEEALGRRYMASDVANAAYVGGPSPMAFSGDGQPTGGLQAPPPQQAYQPSLPPRMAPSARPQVVPGQGGQGFMGMSPEFWQSLMAAGLGTAAAAGRPGATPLGSIGEGGIFGLKTYGGLKGKEADIEMESRKLDQQAQSEADRIAMEGRRLTEMTPYQKQELGLRQQQLEQENWAPFTDQMGNTRFFNRKTGEIRNAPPIHAPGTPMSSTPGTADTAQVQPPETPSPTKEEQKKPLQFAGLETNNVTADDWGKDVKPAGTVTGPVNRNEAVLQDMDPNMQALVKAVADYRKDIRTLGFKDRTLVGRFVTAYDPDWSEANYNTINQTMKNFKGTGVEARNMQSQDMAIQHVGNALDNIRTLDMGNIPLINMLKTGAMEQYDPKTQAALGKLKTDIHAVGDELTRSFRGSGQPSEKEATQWMDNLDYNNPAKMRASLQEAASLLGGRIVASGSRYNDAMGERYARDPLEWMSGKGRAAYQRALSIDPIKGEGPTPQAGQAAAGPTVVRSGTVNSGPNAGKRVIEYSDGHREYQ